MPPVTVAVLGASGVWLGKPLTEGFLANGGYAVTIVARKGSDPSKFAALTGKGAKLVEYDPDSEASLVEALKGNEIVVSAVGATALLEQIKQIDAAKAAGARRFVPSEFGINLSEPGLREYFPAFGYKYAVRDKVEASGLEWTYMATGFFIESQLSPLFYFDPANLKATIKGNADQPFVITSLTDVGKWTAEALLRPESKNATICLPGEKLSYNEILKIFEDAKGKKFAVTRLSKEEAQAEIDAFGANLWGAFVDLLLKSISDGKGTTWDDKIFPGLSPRSVSLADFAKAV